MTEHAATLEEYRAVVSTYKHAEKVRAIHGTRYIVRCSCGWSVSGCDYIGALRHWRTHKGVGND